jgi:hypothetical protein
MRASRALGAVGESARAVLHLLKAHIVKEEEFAMPPLALHPRLAQDEFDSDMGRCWK